MMPRVILTSYGMGDKATADDYSEWVAYVVESLPRRLRMSIEFDVQPFGSGPTDFRVTGVTDDNERSIITKGLMALWQNWCFAQKPSPSLDPSKTPAAG